MAAIEEDPDEELYHLVRRERSRGFFGTNRSHADVFSGPRRVDVVTDPQVASSSR